ncbi:hypothetical protein JCM24511_05900 [Saitozyma sp. JCM 24511]|nr:hypothetical protein JCM24511_05900 [Saitozyma sp. JCM 24511]
MHSLQYIWRCASRASASVALVDLPTQQGGKQAEPEPSVLNPRTPPRQVISMHKVVTHQSTGLAY